MFKQFSAASLLPGEPFQLAQDDETYPAVADESHDRLIAAIGTHNLSVNEQNMVGGNQGQGGGGGTWDGTWNVTIHSLRLQSAAANRPTQNQINSAIASVQAKIDQSVVKRLAIYTAKAAPLLPLIGQDADISGVYAFNAYMGRMNAAIIGADGKLAGVIEVEFAPIVYPYTFSFDGTWLTGTDNTAAWAAFVA